MWLLSILSGNDLRIIWIWQEYGKSSMLRTDSMDLSKVLAELRQELENLDAAILSLERLQQEGRRRGRPPKALSEITKAARMSREDEEAEEPRVEKG